MTLYSFKQKKTRKNSSYKTSAPGVGRVIIVKINCMLV